MFSPGKGFSSYFPTSDEDFLSNADAVKAEEGTEVWPPREYDPLGPLELPFGPRTRHTRTLLSGEVRMLQNKLNY